MLPRGLLSLPKTYPVMEHVDQDVSQLPQKLRRLGICGGLRISSWLSLPKSLQYVHNASVYLSQDDVTKCLQTLKSEMDTNGDEKTLVVPDDLLAMALREHESELAANPFIANTIVPLLHIGSNITLKCCLLASPTWFQASALQHRGSAA